MLSTSFKFSKKDTACNCADTKQNCVFLPFLSDLFSVSRLLRNKNATNINLYIYYIYNIYIYIYIYMINIYIYICMYIIVTKGRCLIYL